MTAKLDRLAAARQALAELGVTVTELQDSQHSHHMPTLGEYLPVVIAAAGPGANRTYGTYWTRMATTWGDRRLHKLLASDIEAMKNTAAKTARSRHSSRHGRYAGEHVVAAARAIYNRAIADDLIDHKNSPAHRVMKPRRLPNTRRALTAWELEQINTTARVSGNDAILDALLLRLHTETACRRGGALAIRLRDLDTDRCLVKLREKGSTTHHPHLGRTPLRVWRRPRPCGTHRQHRPSHHDRHQGQSARSRDRTRPRPDNHTPWPTHGYLPEIGESPGNMCVNLGHVNPHEIARVSSRVID
jgi:hypothetical protein